MTVKLLGSIPGASADAVRLADLNALRDTIEGPEVTRTMSYSNGGLGAILTTLNNTAQSWRFVVRLPVTTSRWRIKLRHYDTYSAATKTAVTGQKIIMGDHSRTMTSPAAETGSFVGSAATTIVGSSFTIPGDGSWYTGPWVTAAGDQFEAGVEHLIGVGWSGGATVNVMVGTGRAWFWTNATSGTDPTVAGSGGSTQNIPLDWVIEYEYTSRKGAWLWFGDSIMEGYMSGPGAAVAPASLMRRYSDQWGLMTGMPVQNHSLAGVTAQMMASGTHGIWTRQDTSLGQFTGAVIGYGSNDAFNSRTTAQVQADLLACIGTLQTIIGAGKPIYAVNILARNFTGWSAQENCRTGVNSWLSELPAGVRAVIDGDARTRTSSATVMDAVLKSSDNIHLSWQGQALMSTVVRGVLPE